MLVQEHVWVLGKCLACGAGQAADYALGKDQRSCIWRENFTFAADLAPEPKLRQKACEDVDAISERLRELREESERARGRTNDQPADSWF